MTNPRRHPHNVDTAPPKLTEAEVDARSRLDMLRSALDDAVEELCGHPLEGTIADALVRRARLELDSVIQGLKLAVHANQISP